MKQKSFYILISTIVVICSCNSNRNPKENTEVLVPNQIQTTPTGLYVNSTVIENNDHNLIGYTPNYCLELNFITPDSVIIYNGFEGEYKLLFTKEKDNLYNLKDASHLGSMPFKILTDSTLLLIDTVWTKTKIPTVFKKTKNNLSFENYMNIKNIAGIYTLKNLINSSVQNIEFTSNNKIIGSDDFNSYQLCFAGDCLNEPLEERNTILLIGEKNSNTYAMIKDTKSNTISLHPLEPTKEDEQGERALSEKTYELIPQTIK